MRRVHKNLCTATISASIMAANMWKNSLKNVESDNKNILYEILLDFFSQRNGTYCLNKPRSMPMRTVHVGVKWIVFVPKTDDIGRRYFRTSSFTICPVRH